MVFLIILVSLVFIETTVLLVKSFKGAKTTNGKRKIYVDTSALMDGRVLRVAKTGFLGDNLIIPRSAIREMQLLADGKDSEKRLRARFGMDVVSELERVVFCDTEILEDALDRTPVDERLISLAKENKGIILTCDYNLEKVAKTEGVEVLNINDLAIVLGNKFHQGDKFSIKIVGKGHNPGQGVGYSDDGTMVVVDRAERLIGEEVEVNFVRFLQTSSGRIVFAKLAGRQRSATATGRRKTKRG